MNIQPKRQVLPSVLNDQRIYNPRHYGARRAAVACNNARASDRNIEHFELRTLLTNKGHIYEEESFQEDKILSLLIESAVSNCQSSDVHEKGV